MVRRGSGRFGTATGWLAAVLGLLIAAWAGAVCLLYAFQDRILYLPSNDEERTPKAVGLDFEELGLEVGTARRVAAWYVPKGGARGTLLFCHGNAGNMTHRVASIKQFHDLGLNVLIFDYAGYGRSAGEPSEEATYLDARTAWNHLVRGRRTPAERIVVFGRSLGGAVAAWLATEVHPAGLILESTFTSLPDLARDLYPLFVFPPLTGLLRYRYDTLSRIQDVGCPVFIVHSTEDEIVGIHHGQRLFNEAREPRYFLPMRGDHNSGPMRTGASYVDGLDRYLSAILVAGR